MRRSALLACAAVLLAACGSRAATPSTPTPRPSFTPEAVATAEREGVRVTLSLDRRRVAPKEAVWADVLIENTNAASVWWIGGGCNFPARVSATVATSGLGAQQPLALAEWKKRWLLPYTAPASFVPESAWAEHQRTGSGPACTADIRIQELAAKGVLRMRAAWDGTIGGPLSRADAPNGTSTVTASFPITFAPAPPGQFRDLAGKLEIAASATIELVGRATVIAAGEALDAALADPRFRPWLEERLADERAGYRLEGGLHLQGATWRVAVAQKVPAGGAAAVHEGGVRIDAATGTVTAVDLRRR
ncbi:MAG TPA: hypothetical protein VFM93_13570 [Candidatus Limnocylindria bacterium]|nr:hypothetical protein [Candidatus Limnocylindria bacterium]